MTVTDEDVEELMKLIEKKTGRKCYLVTGKEKEMSDEEREEGK